LDVDGATAITAYRREGDTLVFTHTEVPEELEGQGIGSRLIEGALADVRGRGLKVVPLCAFVRHYIDTHEDVQDLLA
jgi:predicted GNAT family acetyltransferase